MAEPTEADGAPEPSMEEILASIRKIIADDKEPVVEPPSIEPDVLELTQMVQDDGSVVDLAAEPIASEEPPAMPPAAPAFAPVMTDDLTSERAANAAKSSLEALANTLQVERLAANMSHVTPIGNGARTLEDMVMELMRPMLKAWLDQNLPGTVERLVQKEVERISRKMQD